MHLTPTRTRTERQEGGDFAQKPSKFIGFLKHTFVILRLINLSYGAISKTKRAKISSQYINFNYVWPYLNNNRQFSCF